MAVRQCSENGDGPHFSHLQDLGIRLEPRLWAILEQEYPRFSDAEYARRHRALSQVMQQRDIDHLLIVTDHRAGNAPQWVTGWPGTVEAYVVFRPGEQVTMHVEWYNHLPLAKRLARGVDVRWGEHRGIAKTVAELKRRGATTFEVERQRA